jgi:hypothetical protein
MLAFGELAGQLAIFQMAEDLTPKLLSLTVSCHFGDGSRGAWEGHMDGRRVVAEGTDDTRVSWVIWARRDAPRDGDLLSMIRLTDPGGRILHVGAASGPPLYPGRLLNITTSGSEEGPRALLGRVDPSVKRLELRMHDGGMRNVPLYDCADIPEVRFAALLLPREELLDSVAGFSAQGPELERFDLRFQQGRWEARYLGQAMRSATLLRPGGWRAAG